MKLNGKIHDLNWVSHQEIMKGAIMDFGMSANPEMKRGVNSKSAPYSFSDTNK
jgi:putative alpha-1,2-mannosidase